MVLTALVESLSEHMGTPAETAGNPSHHLLHVPWGALATRSCHTHNTHCSLILFAAVLPTSFVWAWALHPCHR